MEQTLEEQVRELVDNEEFREQRETSKYNSRLARIASTRYQADEVHYSETRRAVVYRASEQPNAKEIAVSARFDRKYGQEALTREVTSALVDRYTRKNKLEQALETLEFSIEKFSRSPSEYQFEAEELTERAVAKKNAYVAENALKLYAKS